MHFPPYHKKERWQYFFVGSFVGGLIAYAILIYMSGSMYEDLLAENLQQGETIQHLERQNEALLEDRSDWNASLLIQQIQIDILNEKEFRLDSLLISQLKSALNKEIDHLIGVEIQTISDSEQLLISAIENKHFKIDETTYRFTVSRLFTSKTLRVGVDIEIIN